MEEILERKTVKGFEQFLTPEDIAFLLQRPVRYVREKLLVTRIIRAGKTGGNSWRVDPDEFRKWKAAGCPTGERFSKPSGGKRRKR
jgi:hypothetical protein